MGLRPGNAARFFAPEDSTPATLRERIRWLENPEVARLYAAAEDGTLPIFEEIAQLTLNGANSCEHSAAWPTQPYDLCRLIGSRIEPDWVVLRADGEQLYRLIGGAVCFASSWEMTEKLGRHVELIHVIVPGLNPVLGNAIKIFLSKLEPGVAWERENWGLSADGELNHHPSLPWKRLGADATLDSTWLRLERQLFMKLPRTGAVLFGIRLNPYPLSEIAADTKVAARLARALKTMPEDVAVYKGIEPARAALIAELNAAKLVPPGGT